MPDHALELSFADADERAVLAQWEALRAASIPSQADHRSMTNAPHLTLVAARGIEQRVVDAATELMADLLPARIHLRGTLLLGDGPRVTIATLAEPDAEVAAAVAQVRAMVPHVRHPVWTPHITLARRVPRRLLPRALEVLHETEAPKSLVADRLRWWDPENASIEDVVGPV